MSFLNIFGDRYNLAIFGSFLNDRQNEILHVVHCWYK